MEDQNPRSSAFIGGSTPPGPLLPEWVPLDAVWVTRPHAADTWPGCLDAAVGQWEAWVAAMREAVAVRVTQDEGIATNDSWVRDYAPLFARRADGPLVAHVFEFNNWGRKYPGWEADDAAGRAIAAATGLPAVEHGWVLEGGAIDTDGTTLLTTEQCLLHANRNGPTTRDAVERRLHEAFALDRIVWLPGGVAGDDTDGHVDDVARFVAPGVVAAVKAPPGHEDHDITAANLAALDAAGLDAVVLPAPRPIRYRYPDGEAPVPASYANFLIANGRVFLPVFGQRGDDVAADRLGDAMPGHAVVPLRAEHLVVGLGAFHCLSMQQPAAG